MGVAQVRWRDNEELHVLGEGGRDSGGERFLLSFRGPSQPATSVADLGGGVYGFAYASAVSGPYVMSLTLHGVHLPGSPFTVTLREHAT